MTEKQNGNGWKGLLPWISQIVVVLLALGASWQSLKYQVADVAQSQKELRSEVIDMISQQKADILCLVNSQKDQMSRELQLFKDSGSSLAIKDHDRIVVLEETYKTLTTTLGSVEKTMEMNFNEIKKQLSAHIADKP